MMSRASMAAAGCPILRHGCYPWLRHRTFTSSSSSSWCPAKVQEEEEKEAVRKIPWLLVSSPHKPESRFLYDFTQDEEDYKKKITREIHLPQLSYHYLIGSSQGFLFSLNEVAEMHATNPLTGVHLPIPTTGSLPNMVGVIRFPSDRAGAQPASLGKISGYVVCVNKWSNPPCLQHLYADTEMQYLYFTKAILSHSLDTAVVIHGSNNYSSGQIAFSRIRGGGGGGQHQSSSWTALPAPIHLFNDIVFHRGRLHAIDYCGTVAIFDDLDDNHPLTPPILSPKGPLKDHALYHKRSLIESPDGEDLFLVFRGLYTPEELEKIGDRRASYRYSLYWEDEKNPPRTKTFEVYKLDHNSYKWNQIESIGDLALFLGYNHSFALSARDCPTLQRNSIYFTDQFFGYYEAELAGDTGVCNLQDGSINFYPLCFDGRQDLEFNWPPPIWYMP